MSTILIILYPLVVGYVIGLLQRGIQITINNKEKETEYPTEYNNSHVDEMPEEIRNYYDQTQGMNKF